MENVYWTKITHIGKARQMGPLFGLIGSLGLIAVSLLCVYGGASGSAPSSAEMDLAMHATVAVILTNSACPTTSEEILRVAGGYFPLLHPELANRQRLSDPRAVQADAVAAWSMLNPGAFHRQRMMDPDYRRAFDETTGWIAEMNRRAAVKAQ